MAGTVCKCLTSNGGKNMVFVPIDILVGEIDNQLIDKIMVGGSLKENKAV